MMAISMSEFPLSSLKSIVEGSLRGSEREELLRALCDIETKYSSDELKVAVVGEFSSGKSTFINSLLGFRLLVDGVFPTTASATYIDAKQEGGSTELRVAFRDGNEFKLSETLMSVFGFFSRFVPLLRYLLRHYNVRPNSIYEVIRLLTSDQKIAQEVKKIELHLPSRIAGKEGIVDIDLPTQIRLIDTPGFNPGEESVSNHFEITKNVVENEADLAIILTPLDRAMSHSLATFMRESIAPYLHRCIFVITKADQWSEQEQQSVIQFVRDQLVGEFKLANPKIYCVSAICMLPVLNMPEERRILWSGLQKNFRAFEQDLWSYVGEARRKAISEHSYRLLVSVIERLKKELAKKREQILSTRSFLERNRIKHIEDCTRVLVEWGENRLGQLYNGSDLSAASFTKETSEACEQLVWQCENLKDFGRTYGPKIREIINWHLSCYNTRTKEILQCFKSLMEDEILKHFDREFASHYRDMPSLRPRKMQLPQDADNATHFLDEEQVQKNVNEIIENARVTLPIIGDVHPDSIWTNIFSFFISVDKTKVKREICAKLVSMVSDLFEEVERGTRDACSQFVQLQCKYLEAVADVNVKTYGHRVKHLILDHEEKLAKLEKEYSSLTDHEGKAERIRANVQHSLIKLNGI